MPNTAHAKLAFTGNRLGVGLAYVGAGLLFVDPLLLPALAVTHARKDEGNRRRLPVIPTWYLARKSLEDGGLRGFANRR